MGSNFCSPSFLSTLWVFSSKLFYLKLTNTGKSALGKIFWSSEDPSGIFFSFFLKTQSGLDFRPPQYSTEVLFCFISCHPFCNILCLKGLTVLKRGPIKIITTYQWLLPRDYVTCTEQSIPQTNTCIYWWTHEEDEVLWPQEKNKTKVKEMAQPKF